MSCRKAIGKLDLGSRWPPINNSQQNQNQIDTNTTKNVQLSESNPKDDPIYSSKVHREPSNFSSLNTEKNASLLTSQLQISDKDRNNTNIISEDQNCISMSTSDHLSVENQQKVNVSSNQTKTNESSSNHTLKEETPSIIQIESIHQLKADDGQEEEPMMNKAESSSSSPPTPTITPISSPISISINPVSSPIPINPLSSPNPTSPISSPLFSPLDTISSHFSQAIDIPCKPSTLNTFSDSSSSLEFSPGSESVSPNSWNRAKTPSNHSTSLSNIQYFYDPKQSNLILERGSIRTQSEPERLVNGFQNAKSSQSLFSTPPTLTTTASPSSVLLSSSSPTTLSLSKPCSSSLKLDSNQKSSKSNKKSHLSFSSEISKSYKHEHSTSSTPINIGSGSSSSSKKKTIQESESSRFTLTTPTSIASTPVTSEMDHPVADYLPQMDRWPDALWQGWMKKRNKGKESTAQRRYLVVKTNCIEYYSDPEAANPKGSISFDNLAIRFDEKIFVRVKEKEWEFQVEKERDLARWHVVFKAAIMAINR